MDSSSHSVLTQARALMASGRWREARPLLEPLAAAPACDSWVLRQLAEIALAEADPRAARDWLARCDTDGDDEAAFLAARADAAEGRLEEARAAFLALRARLQTPSAMLELHLAAVEQRRGDIEAAIAALSSAATLNPGVAAAHKNLAALLAAAGRADEALAALRSGVAALPADASLWLRLARLQADRGDADAALASLERARAAGPGDAAAWRELGILYAEYWRWADADAALVEASRRDPGAPATETLWSIVKQELGDTAGALAALERSSARDAGDLQTAMSLRLMLPQVYADEAQLAGWRERYARGLDDLNANVERWLPRAADVFNLTRTNFLLAYQGGDDRELQRGYSSFIARLAAAAHPEWRAPRERRFDGGRRLRIGFVGGIFRDCTAGRYFERWITGLDRARFERFVYHISPIADDFTARIAAGAEHFVTLREGAQRAAARLAADELDVIVYPEVGMTPTSYLLAALRLAPVQCAGWGHPVTTGSDAMDHYITCAPMEPQDGARHYVERLIALPEIGVDYAMPVTPPQLTRADFRLQDNARVYLCAQSLFKVHPAMDAVFGDLLEADGEAVLAFFQAPTPQVTRQFADRIQRVITARGLPPRGQVKFLPRLAGAYFRRVLALADVVLDTLHWSGGNTSLDAFSVGSPVVTLPAQFMRGRQTAAMLALMGIEQLTAIDQADYVRRAVAVASDRDLNAGLRELIAERRAALFDRPEPIAALQEALLAAAAKT